MRRSVSRALVLVLCGTVCVSTTAVSSIFSVVAVSLKKKEDRNGDGRPDVWRTYDRRGRLTEVAFDTNFDGRSDVLEYYDQGALVRRETDRNFDGRVDLVESFDRLTHERVRSIADVDYDGRADLLVLFRDGRTVYSKWAAPVAPIGRSAWDPGRSGRPAADLESLDDPFRADLRVEGLSPTHGPEDGGALAVSGGMPAPRVDGATPPRRFPRSSTSASVGPGSPRGPPASPLFGSLTHSSFLIVASLND